MKNTYNALNSKKTFKIGVYFSLIFFTVLFLLIIAVMLVQRDYSLETILFSAFVLAIDLFFLHIITYRIRFNGTQIIITRLFRKKVIINSRNINRKIEVRVLKPRLGIEFTRVVIYTDEKKIVVNYTNKELVDILVKSGFKIK
ncbi:MAG: hypothetical protein KKH01_00865 [Firmicutes bacterium]|nr:hypothetical protein [Bacillota bacterium]